MAIVDDEIIFAKAFAKTLEQNWKNAINKLSIFLSAESFLSSNEIYDIMFLDIEMSGITGIELARKHIDKNTKIVFVTNRDDLVFDAYNTTDAIGFVRKSNIDSDLKTIAERIKKSNLQNLSLSVKSGSTIAKIKYCEIIYIEKIAHNIIIRTAQGSYSKRTTLSDIEVLLSPSDFVRTHVGYLVNLAHIKLIKSGNIVLSNGETLPVSRRYIKQVKDKFLERSVQLYE